MAGRIGARWTNESRWRMGAKKLGISTCEYLENIEAGLIWCSGHKAWEPRSAFGPCRTRANGLTTSCSLWERENARVGMRRLREERKAAS